MKILLIAPYFLNLYLDVKYELERQGHAVTSLEDIGYKDDPYLIRSKPLNTKLVVEQDMKNKLYWEGRLNGIVDKYFDVLLLINGTSFSRLIVDKLKIINPCIKTYLYLWDRTYQNYCFDRAFPFFDSIYTFDKVDAEKFGIQFLPFYWIPSESSQLKYVITGFGSYRDDRYKVFKPIYDLAKASNLDEFIRLFHPVIDQSLMGRIKRLFGKLVFHRDYIPDEIYKSEIITHKQLNPIEFRELIFASECVVDTNNFFQEGMTPRFMWALGAGKKIITTNRNAKNYPFYTEEQIYILNDGRSDSLMEFIKKDFTMKPSIQKNIENYRIDNWIKTLLS